MTSYAACSSCNEMQWKQYGRAMVRTYLRHWPAEVPLYFFSECFEPEPIEALSKHSSRPENQAKAPFLRDHGPNYLDGNPASKVVLRGLNASAPWLAEFKQKYGGDVRWHGGPDGRDYRRNAIKFSNKVAALGAAADEADCDVLIWIDADIVTFAPVDRAWLDSLFPKSAQLAWLDRIRGIYPECGFVMYRMPDCAKLIGKLVAAYREGAIFKLAEQHDSYVLQQVANEMAAHGRLRIHSLSGEGRIHTGHPFCASRLAERLDHLKGESRKVQGHSHARDLKVPRPEAYWQKVKRNAP